MSDNQEGIFGKLAFQSKLFDIGDNDSVHDISKKISRYLERLGKEINSLENAYMKGLSVSDRNEKLELLMLEAELALDNKRELQGELFELLRITDGNTKETIVDAIYEIRLKNESRHDSRKEKVERRKIEQAKEKERLDAIYKQRSTREGRLKEIQDEYEEHERKYPREKTTEKPPQPTHNIRSSIVSKAQRDGMPVKVLQSDERDVLDLVRKNRIEELKEWVLTNERNVNYTDSKGYSLLYYAVRFGRDKIIDFLLGFDCLVMDNIDLEGNNIVDVANKSLVCSGETCAKIYRRFYRK